MRLARIAGLRKKVFSFIFFFFYYLLFIYFLIDEVCVSSLSLSLSLFFFEETCVVCLK